MITFDAFGSLLGELLGQPMPPLTPAFSLADLPGWDSVAHVSLLLALEKRLGLRFPAARMFTIHTLGELYALCNPQEEPHDHR